MVNARRPFSAMSCSAAWAQSEIVRVGSPSRALPVLAGAISRHHSPYLEVLTSRSSVPYGMGIMTTDLPDPGIAALDAALDAVEGDARALVGGITETLGRWQPAPGAWSVAECLDHLATANRVYLRAMEPV